MIPISIRASGAPWLADALLARRVAPADVAPDIRVRTSAEPALALIGGSGDPRHPAERAQPAVVRTFELARMGSLTAGHGRSKASGAQQQLLHDVFRLLLVCTYAIVLENGAGGNIRLSMAVAEPSPETAEANVRACVVAGERR